MNEVFRVELFGGKTDRWCDLELPATYYGLSDALDKLQMTLGDKPRWEFLEHHGFQFLHVHLNHECDLYQLNALATCLGQMNGRERTAFEGLFNMEVAQKYGPISVATMIDLAYSADCCHVVNATTDEQLGRFYAENDFIPALEKVPDSIFEYLDFEMLGRKARFEEGGVFASGGYVTQHTELKQVYDSLALIPEAPQYGIRLTVGRYPFHSNEQPDIINVLEPKCWDDGGDPNATDAPEAFRKSTLLAQHISFLKDFFRAYKDFSDAHIDTIEIMLSKLYRKFGITERTNFNRMCPEDYPILSDLYDLIEEEFKTYDADRHQLYTQKLLQEVLLGLHSMCKGADAQFFNGHTNITSSRFLVFGVKGMLSAAKNVRNAMLFNVLSFMSDKLLTVGNTVAALDELYIWLSNPTAIEYIRNCLKRVRKKESAMLLASQNLEDFDQEGVREMTKPLFSIPPHQFLFNAGSIDKRSYMDMLQLEESEYNLIKFPQRGVCLYKCGNERYLLEVHAPAYKEKLFGTAGGR